MCLITSKSCISHGALCESLAALRETGLVEVLAKAQWKFPKTQRKCKPNIIDNHYRKKPFIGGTAVIPNEARGLSLRSG